MISKSKIEEDKLHRRDRVSQPTLKELEKLLMSMEPSQNHAHCATSIMIWKIVMPS